MAGKGERRTTLLGEITPAALRLAFILCDSCWREVYGVVYSDGPGTVSENIRFIGCLRHSASPSRPVVLRLLILLPVTSYSCTGCFCSKVQQTVDGYSFIDKQIQLVGKRFRIKIHQNTTNSYFLLLTFRSLSETFIRIRSWY